MEGRKIRYDCTYLQFNNGRLSCSKGVKLSLAKDGRAKLILKGEAPKACQDCSLYTKGELLCT